MAKTVIYYSKSGEVKKIKSNAGRTRHNKAAFELRRNNVEPPTRYKLIRFIRRIVWTLKHYYIKRRYYSEQAAIIPPIGLFEG